MSSPQMFKTSPHIGRSKQAPNHLAWLGKQAESKCGHILSGSRTLWFACACLYVILCYKSRQRSTTKYNALGHYFSPCMQSSVSRQQAQSRLLSAERGTHFIEQLFQHGQSSFPCGANLLQQESVFRLWGDRTGHLHGLWVPVLQTPSQALEANPSPSQVSGYLLCWTTWTGKCEF